MTDLTQTLIEAAEAAIRKQEGAIKDGARQLRSIRLELEIADGSGVIETTTYLEWRRESRRGRMTDGRLRIATEEDRARLHVASRYAGICAACGRAIAAGETVYLERFRSGRLYEAAPVGEECASPDTLARAAGMEPERCAACGRGVYYHPRRRRRTQAVCSRLCMSRAAGARQREARG